jgi:hypothetical protein
LLSTNNFAQKEKQKKEKTKKGIVPMKTPPQLIYSLNAELNTAKNDTNRVIILNGLAVQYLETTPDSGIIFANQAIEQAKLLKWEKGVAVVYKNKICDTFSHEDYHFTGEYELIGLNLA